jgi:hypothetical protein
MRRREFIAAFGGAVVSPLVARAQTDEVVRLGYLALLPGEDTTLAKPLLQRLQELGYRRGMNMILEYRSADGRAERLPQLAAELVRAPREGWRYQHVQAIIISIDQYAEAALGNREFFLNKPYGIGGSRTKDNIP